MKEKYIPPELEIIEFGPEDFDWMGPLPDAIRTVDERACAEAAEERPRACGSQETGTAI